MPNALKIVRYVTSLTFVMFVREGTVNPMEKLKPCPFCGGYAELKVQTVRGFDEHRSYKVACTECGTFAGNGIIFDLYIKSKTAERRAIAAWNRRVESDV